MLKLNRGLLAASMIASLNVVPVSNAHAVSDEVAVQLLERLGDLEKELRNLRGENEMLRNELLEVRSTQREGFLEVDERVSGLEKNQKPGSEGAQSVDTEAAVSITTTPGAGIAEQVPALESPAKNTAEISSTSATGEPVPDVSSDTDKDVASVADAEQRRAIAPVTAPAAQADKTVANVDPSSPESYYFYGTEDKNKTGVVDSSKASLSSEKPVKAVPGAVPDTHKAKASYNQAYKLLVNDPQAAVPAFRAFMETYPNHELVANAQYWLGEALYAQKEYSAASEEFIQVLKKHKSSPKAPGAALKLGYSFYELRQWDFARRTLEDTVQFFPGTNAATLAKSRLERMKTEGR